MSTESEPTRRPLTRRELRELRAKGVDPVESDAASPEEDPEQEAPSAEAGVASEAAPVADADADPVESAEDAPAESEASDAEPGAGEAVEDEPERAPEGPRAPHLVASAEDGADGRRPLTRRELRRLRTNELPVIGSEGSERTEADEADAPEELVAETETTGAEATEVVVDEPADAEETAGDERRPMPWEAPIAPQPERRDTRDEETVALTVIDPSGARTDQGADAEAPRPPLFTRPEPPRPEPSGAEGDAPSLAPTFGAGIAPKRPQESFDDLIARGNATSPSSIIMTSSHRLPEGLGSTGAARGTTDGREVDGVLLDSELPPASSPTPIAASSAISTQKSAGEVLRPPKPEKGRGIVLVLGITAGVLGLAIIGTLVGAYAMGVFN
ncbi:hypothetical protein [Microbacterium sp. gxy059]|uniref:hypothetical protein n=1 Tax=Microbacterium sp. gxy059 TaxID=2957199 RepID=UPI003D99C128